MEEITAETGQMVLKFNNRLVCSKYNPWREAEQWARSALEGGDRHFVVMGVGLGYHLKALAEICNRELSGFHVLGIELEPQFQNYLELPDLKGLKCLQINAQDPARFEKILGELPSYNFKLLRFLPAYQFHRESYLELEEAMTGRTLESLGRQLSFRPELGFLPAALNGCEATPLSILNLNFRLGEPSREKTLWSILRELVK